MLGVDRREPADLLVDDGLDAPLAAKFRQEFGSDARAKMMEFDNMAFKGEITKPARRWARAGHVNCRQTQSRFRHRR